MTPTPIAARRQLERRLPRTGEIKILVVTEDPGFFTAVYERLTPLGARVTGCMGPVASPCQLDDKGYCSLAGRARLAIVDAPDSGAFVRNSVAVSAAVYGARLACAHPETLVLLCGAPEGAGATGDAVCVKDREVAVDVATYAAMTNGIDLDA